MPTGTFEYRTDAERKAIERAIAFVAEMHDLARTAPAAQVLDQCEQQSHGPGPVGDGAEWIGPFVELLALRDTVEWDQHWKVPAP